MSVITSFFRSLQSEEFARVVEDLDLLSKLYADNQKEQKVLPCVPYWLFLVEKKHVSFAGLSELLQGEEGKGRAI